MPCYVMLWGDLLAADCVASHLRHESKLYMIGLVWELNGVARQIVYCALHAGRRSDAVICHTTSKGICHRWLPCMATRLV
jgi:hypothetical protein